MQCIIVRTSIPEVETDDLYVPIDSIVSDQREYGTIQYSEFWKCKLPNVIVGSKTYSLYYFSSKHFVQKPTCFQEPN